MKLKVLSSLNKVFKDTEPNFPELKEFSALKNENFSFQIAFIPENESETDFSVSLDSVLKDEIKVYYVKNIPAGKNGDERSDSFHYDLNRTEFPDLLLPVTDTISVPQGEWHSLWFEYKPETYKSGEHKIKITINTKGQSFEKEFTLKIIDKELPPQQILYTNWFHNDCLLTYYGVEIFSERYWKIAENYIKNAVEHGMNMILTPVFTPPLDTEVGGERPTVQLVKVTKENNTYSFDFKNFEHYVEICLRNGIKAFEISHLFTQWGAEKAPKIVATVNGEEKRIFGWDTDASGDDYRYFLKQFSKAFREETEALGIKNICWIHVSDEPSESNFETYKKASDIVHNFFSDFNSFDALSDIDFYKKGLIKTPVCGEDEADVFRKEVEIFWTYHCCTQVHNFLPNRMFSQPSLRNRIFGVLLYKYNADGFLQWGHNFWYSQYSKYPINPFEVTDAGGAFPSGDSFMVYPGEDGKPLNALRHKVFLDAMQDLRALRLLEGLKGRDFVLNFIEEGLDVPLSFSTDRKSVV